MNTALPVGFEGQLESKHSNIQLSVERSGADISASARALFGFNLKQQVQSSQNKMHWLSYQCQRLTTYEIY